MLLLLHPFDPEQQRLHCILYSARRRFGRRRVAEAPASAAGPATQRA